MQELIDQLSTYAKGLWIKKWIVLVIAWIVCLIGWPIVLKLPDQYRSNAQVYVDTQSLLKPLLRGLTIQTDPEQQIQMMVRTLLTRPNLEKIARMTDLDLTANTPKEFDTLLGTLGSTIRIGRAGRENLFTISYASDDPVLAKNVVQSTLTTLVENTLGDKRSDSDTAQNFLDKQIAEYDQRIKANDELIKEFKRRYAGMMPGSGQGFYSQLEQARNELNSVELELREAQKREEFLRKQLEGETPSFGLMEEIQPTFSQDISSSYDGRIESLQNNLDQLQLKYTERHPDIREVKRILEDLHKKRDQEVEERQEMIAASAAPRKSAGIDANPVYQEMKLSVAREEARVQTLKVRANSYRQKVDSLSQKMNTIPEIEAEYASLLRGQDVTQNKYHALLQRRESARLSQSAEVDSESFQFRVIDPPRVPTTPSGPKRLVFLTAVIIAGIGAGLGVAFLITQLRPVFFDSKQLNRITGIPVLGSVEMLHTPSIIKTTRRRGFFFLIFAALLLSLYGSIMALQLKPELNQKLLAIIPDVPAQIQTHVPALTPVINKLKELF